MIGNRKVVLYVATSLDGYIARKDGSVDWLPTLEDEDFGYSEFLSTVDTVIMGRTTYEQVLTFGPYPYRGKKGYVFSRSRGGKGENVEFVDEDVRTFINRLRSQDGSDIWLVGGAQLIDAFRAADMIDRYIISMTPVILSEGIPMFLSGGVERRLRLRESRTFPAGLVQSCFDAVR